MEMLGISESEQRAVWRVLAAIYHLGVAGACKGTSFLPGSPGRAAVSFGRCLTRPFSERWEQGQSVTFCVSGTSLGEAAETRRREEDTGLAFQANLLDQLCSQELSAMMEITAVQCSNH